MTTTEPSLEVWRRRDGVRSRLLTLHSAVCYIADQHSGDSRGLASVFNAIADGIEREFDEVNELVEGEPEGGAS